MQFHRDNHRGNTTVTIPMRVLYGIIRERLEYVRTDTDLDAATQNICVEVEKAMGIFPNLPYRSDNAEPPDVRRIGDPDDLVLGRHRTAFGDFIIKAPPGVYHGELHSDGTVTARLSKDEKERKSGPDDVTQSAPEPKDETK